MEEALRDERETHGEGAEQVQKQERGYRGPGMGTAGS